MCKVLKQAYVCIMFPVGSVSLENPATAFSGDTCNHQRRILGGEQTSLGNNTAGRHLVIPHLIQKMTQAQCFLNSSLLVGSFLPQAQQKLDDDSG